MFRVFCVSVCSCLLSLFGIVIITATLYDVLTSVVQRRKARYNDGLQSAVTEDGAGDGLLINNRRTASVLSRTDDDLPLILDTAEYETCCQRACGISSWSSSCICATNFFRIYTKAYIIKTFL